MTIQVTSTTNAAEAARTTAGSLAGAKDEDKATETKTENQKAASESSKDTEAEEQSVDESAEAESEDSDKEVEAEESDEPKEEKQKPKKKGGFQKKLERKEKEIEYWKEKALKGEQEKQPEVKAQVDDSKKPQEKDFESISDYLEALTDWKVEQREKAEALKKQEAEIKDSFKKSVTDFQKKTAEFAKTVDDYDDVIADAGDIQISYSLQSAIIESDIGPQVLYELAKDTDELERINALSPIAQAREIGKIEARLSVKSETPKEQIKQKSNAPKPVTPLSAKTTVTKKSIFDKDLSQSEYEKLRREQLNKKGF